MGAYLIHDINKRLGGIFGEAIGEFGSVFAGGEFLDPENDFVRNQASIGLYIDIVMGWKI